VPNRFEDGYGLSPEVVDQAHALGAQMIMTVDNGISSHAGVDRAHALGIPVLVTDHHLPGDTLPAAEAIINPTCATVNSRPNHWPVWVWRFI
jgi:single-stranded-DNA-specific exonuclease